MVSKNRNRKNGQFYLKVRYNEKFQIGLPTFLKRFDGEALLFARLETV